jgi:hypothetical protein
MNTMFKSIAACIIIIIMLGFVSCETCIEGNEKIIPEDRSQKIGSFTEVESNGAFDIYIRQDSVEKVVVEGDENILPYILTRKQGNKLIIETESGKCYSNKNAIKVYINIKQLTYAKLDGSGIIDCHALVADKLELILSGSGNLNFYNILLNELNAKIDGSGNIDLSGSSNRAILVNNGSGSIKGDGLVQQNSIATINGSGNIYVRFVESLVAKIYGSGNIHFIGNKNKITKTDNGSGDLIDDN